MKNAENILVLTSIIFTVVIVSVMNRRMPMSNLKDWYFGKNVRFDKTRFPDYLKLLIGVAAASLLYGFLISRGILLTLQFVAFNLAVTATVGINLVLYRRLK